MKAQYFRLIASPLARLDATMGRVFVVLEAVGDYWIASVYAGEAGERRRLALSAFVTQQTSGAIARLAPGLSNLGLGAPDLVDRLSQCLDELRGVLHPDVAPVGTHRALPRKQPRRTNVQRFR